jgi:hypothetical protein
VSIVHRTSDRAAQRVSGSTRRKKQTYFRVEENQAIFHHYFSLEFDLATTLAGAVSTLPDLEAKCEVSHHLHSAMLRARDMRARLRDFLVSEPERKVLPQWRNFVRHLMTAKDDVTLLGALYHVIRPAQYKAYGLHYRYTLPVNDAPTRELFEMHLPLLKRDIDWGTDYLKRKEQEGRARDLAFEQALREHLYAIGGIFGVRPPADGPPVADYPEWRYPPEMALEERFTIRSADRYTLPDWPEYEAIPTAYTHFTELPVIDIVGSIVYDGRQYDMPFDYYLEFIRQMWDEARHTMMGFERLKAFGVDPYSVPIPVGHYTVWTSLSLLHRLASLTQVGEACSFEPKRAWVAAAWKRNDPLSALEHEYDIVDERTHVTFGSRWIKHLMQITGEQRDVKTVVQDADWEFREKINELRKQKGEKWVEDLGQRFMGCGTNTSPVSLAPALDGIPNIIA